MSAVDSTTFCRLVYIYGLTDPDSGAIRYVGKAERPWERLVSHIAAAPRKQYYSQCWVAGLLAAGKRPQMVILEIVSESLWAQAECAWIAKLREDGCELTNISLGGDSPSKTPEVRAKQSAIRKGKPCPWLQTPEVRQKSVASRKGKPLRPCADPEARRIRVAETCKRKWPNGRKLSPEARQKLIDANLNRGPVTEATRAKMSASAKRRFENPGEREKVRAASAARKHTEATRAKLRALRASPETRAKISAAGMGRVISAETIAKRIATRRANRSKPATGQSYLPGFTLGDG